MAGSALFTYTNPSGILVSQAGVAGVEPFRSGRIFVDESGTFTGIALANPSASLAAISLILRDASGREVQRSSLSLPAHQHVAKYVAQLFPSLPGAFTGTLTIQNRGGLAQTSLCVEPVALKDLAPGHITTIAGGSSFAGDGGTAKSAGLFYPARVALDDGGNLYIADTCHHRIRRVSASTGIITTVGGPGRWGSYGDNGPATAAFLAMPTGLTIDAAGNLFIADTGNYRIRAIRGPLP